MFFLCHHHLTSRGHRDLKKRPGVDFFFPGLWGALTNYMIRHKSKYGNNIMSASEVLPSLPSLQANIGVPAQEIHLVDGTSYQSK